MNTIRIDVHLCSREEFIICAEEHNVGEKWIYNVGGYKHLRGFRAGNHIYMIKDCFGELALMAHEYGHIRGKGHVKWPTIMNFSGLFRWFAK